MTDTAPKIMLKKLKELNTIWHPDSTLVFKSKDEKLVIGRWVDSAFVDLDDTAIQLCETWKFKIDESLIEQPTEEETVVEEAEDEVKDEEEVGVLLPEDEHAAVLDGTVFVEFRDSMSLLELLVKKSFKVVQNELDETKQKLQLKTEEFEALQAKFSALKSLLA
jgi:hypothetical protein